MMTLNELTIRHSVPFVALVLWLSALSRPLPAEPLQINPQTATYDYYPSTSSAADGSIWLAWHGYRSGQDQILARRLSSDGSLGPLQKVSQSGAVHGPPTIICGSDQSVSVVWASTEDDRWRVMLRQRIDGRWLETQPLSSASSDAIYPTAKALSGGRLLVAWSELLRDRFQIQASLVGNGEPSPSWSVSNDSEDAFRPEVVTQDDQAWVLWDQYGQPNYSVQARQLFPHSTAIELVSPEGEFCLKPTALVHGGTLYVAWLRKVNVVGGPGVISQMHTLHAAMRKDERWVEIRGPSGETAAAELTHGLMAKIEPRVIATGGYLGPRTRPMLMADDDCVWLLWERKSDHRGGTPTIAGDLVGRPITDGRWNEPPVVLTRKRLDYHVVDVPEAGKHRLLASRLPRKGLRRYEMFELDVDRSETLEQEAWPGWTPIDLPIESETTPRRTITAGGKTYKLYWADLHCHNGLTADAEGEPDEMHAYARDRAGLDVVAFTNNDFYNVPLTQYEYELGHLFARAFSSPKKSRGRRILSLPGYEWTSRIPGDPNASMADPGNWLPPYRNRSYPNHRSVIYPPGGGPLVHFTEVGNDIARLNLAVQKAGGVTLSQHNAFKLSGHDVEVGLELTSGWSNYIASHPARFHDPLNAGARLGFTANGDTHRRAPGLSGALTGIYAESLSADAILDALRSRRCYATMGSRIFVDARAGEAMMGGQATASDGEITLTLQAEGTRPITGAVLIRDGQVIRRIEGNGSRQLTATVTDENLAQGTHWYYWRVSQERIAPVLPGNLMPAHGHLAWSTPNWVVVK